MIARDLIAQLIRTFFNELDDVRDGRKGETEIRYGDLYVTYFKKEGSFFIERAMSDVLAFFAEDPYAVHKFEMLAELMYRDSQIRADLTEQQMMFRRIIELYDVIDARSMNFSIVRMNRAQELKNRLGINSGE